MDEKRDISEEFSKVTESIEKIVLLQN